MSNSRLLWPRTEELHERYALMDQMMEVQGVDVLTAIRIDRGLAFIEARAKCRYCVHEGVCRHWLASQGQRGAASFCPNLAFFRSCPKTEN